MKLSEYDIKQNLEKLKDWQFIDNHIVKEFQLKNFVDALSFVIKVGIESEKLDHHPEILMYNWNKVKIRLTTHSENGLTEKDFNLANKIDQLV